MDSTVTASRELLGLMADRPMRRPCGALAPGRSQAGSLEGCMWFKKFFGAFAALSLVLAACGTGTPSSSAPAGSGQPSASASASGGELAEDQTLHLAGGEPPTLDPTIADDSSSIQLLVGLQRPLVYFNKDLEITADGGLAQSWDVSKDGKTITFHLKDGIKYSDGNPIVADDFVYSWKRLVDPRTAASYSYVMGDVAGGSELLSLDPEKLPADAEIDKMLDKLGVAAPDPKTFVVTLANAASYFPYIATLWVTVPLEKKWVDSGDKFTEAANYVASGPWTLKTWDHNSKVVMVPNPEWSGDKPKLTSVELTVIDDAAQQYQAYQNGEIDITTVPSANVQQVKDNPDLSSQLLSGDVLATYYVGFDLNTKDDKSPVENKDLRDALSQSIDRQQLIDTVRFGIGSPATSMVPPGMPGHQPDIGLKFDVEAAKASLQKALDGLGLKSVSDLNGKLKLGYNTGGGAAHEEIMQFIQNQWKTNLGLEVTLEPQEWAAYLQALETNPPDIFRLGWSADYPHPNNFLRDVFQCGSGNNNMKYCNKQFDDLLNQAAVAPDLQSQLPLYNQAQQILVDDAPVVFIYWYGRFSLVKPYVKDIVPTSQDSSTGMYFYDKIYIAKHD
jgi:oligopeptide transport system substrate-binding protein